MTGKVDGKKRRTATKYGLAIVSIAGVLILIFSLRGTWVQAKVATVLGLYTVAIALLELGANGRWFPAFSPANGSLSFLGRIGILVVGVTPFISAIAFWYSFGVGSWKLTMAGLVLGLYTTSVAFIRYGFSGKWFLGVSAQSAHAAGVHNGDSTAL